MFKYDPNNLNLLNDIKKQCQEERIKENKKLEKKDFEDYFPLENFDNIEYLKLNYCPKSSSFYMDNVKNKFYEKTFMGGWKDVTNNYDWVKITRNGSFF
jgi:hypothetical protein